MTSKHERRALRSRAWCDNSGNPEMTALYLERFLNYGLTPGELQADRPIGQLDSGACMELALKYRT
jgi:dihydroxy-acid dehydratase